MSLEKWLWIWDEEKLIGLKIRIVCYVLKEKETIRNEMKWIRKERKSICQIGQQECVGNNKTIERKEPKKSLSLNGHISWSMRPNALKNVSKWTWQIDRPNKSTFRAIQTSSSAAAAMRAYFVKSIYFDSVNGNSELSELLILLALIVFAVFAVQSSYSVSWGCRATFLICLTPFLH